MLGYNANKEIGGIKQIRKRLKIRGGGGGLWRVKVQEGGEGTLIIT